MITVGPIVCAFDQDRFASAAAVLVLDRKGSVNEIPLPTVYVAKSRKSMPGNAVCGSVLFAALWVLGEECEDADHRVVYIEEEPQWATRTR